MMSQQKSKTHSQVRAIRRVRPEKKVAHPLFWFWVWFGFAAVMLMLVVITRAEYQTIGLCFFAWCGGVLSTLMVQEQIKRRKARDDSA